MKRREAIKNIGLSAGFAMAIPSFFSLLQSCTQDTAKWIPKYLTEEEKTVLTNLVDIILPKTATTPSASEVNVPQFIDRYIDEVLAIEDKEITRTAFSKIIQLLKPDETVAIKNVTTEQYTAILDKYLLLKGDIDEVREANPKALEMTNSEFLGQIKWLTINAYTKSEEVGKNILVYDPVPTEYYCGDLQELTGGKSYSL